MVNSKPERPLDLSELERLAREYVVIRDSKTELEGRYDDLRRRILTLMEGRDEAETERWLVTVKRSPRIVFEEPDRLSGVEVTGLQVRYSISKQAYNLLDTRERERLEPARPQTRYVEMVQIAERANV